MSLVATDQTWDSYVQSKSDILAFIYIYDCLDKVPYILWKMVEMVLSSECFSYFWKLHQYKYILWFFNCIG